MKTRIAIASILTLIVSLAGSAARAAGAEATLTVDPNSVVGHIDEKIYGQFLEHIYHSVNGGLWGEMVWNRSFEQPAGARPGPNTAQLPRFWTAYGKAAIEQIKDNPLNSDYCVQIQNPGGEGGIQQTPLCIRDGETYHCSIWVRGQSPAGLVVQLLDGAKVLVQQPIASPVGDVWQQFSFDLVPNGSADNGTLQIGLRDKGQICLDQVSVMSDASLSTGGFRPDLLAAIAALRPATIRWPGGSFASKYHWKDAVGPQEQRKSVSPAMWDDQDCNAFGTDEYLRLCQKVGAQPLIVVNTGPHKTMADSERAEFLRDACNWVEYCNGSVMTPWGKLRAQYGHPKPYGVKFWEIDNEVWGFKPEEYIAVLKQFVPAMKKVDPSITVIACGSGQLGGHWSGGDTAVISEAASLVDYLSVHHYENAARFAEGPAAADAFFKKLARQIAQSSNPNLKLYVSEWNAQTTDWRTGLYAGGILNVFERDSDFIGMACPALFLRHVSATKWDNAFINFDHCTWFPAPNYVVMKLYRDHFATDRVELTGNPGPVNAVATRSVSGGKIYLKAVNPSDQPATVKLQVAGGFVVAAADMQLIAPDALDARNTLQAREAVKAVDGPVERDGDAIRFELPRWSVGVVTVYSPAEAPATKPAVPAPTTLPAIPSTAPSTMPATMPTGPATVPATLPTNPAGPATRP